MVWRVGSGRECGLAASAMRVEAHACLAQAGVGQCGSAPRRPTQPAELHSRQHNRRTRPLQHRYTLSFLAHEAKGKGKTRFYFFIFILKQN